MKSHWFWFILVLLWNIEDLIGLLNNTYEFTAINCFFSLIGIFVLIHEARLLINDYKEK